MLKSAFTGVVCIVLAPETKFRFETGMYGRELDVFGHLCKPVIQNVLPSSTACISSTRDGMAMDISGLRGARVL